MCHTQIEGRCQQYLQSCFLFGLVLTRHCNNDLFVKNGVHKDRNQVGCRLQLVVHCWTLSPCYPETEIQISIRREPLMCYKLGGRLSLTWDLIIFKMFATLLALGLFLLGIWKYSDIWLLVSTFNNGLSVKKGIHEDRGQVSSQTSGSLSSAWDFMIRMFWQIVCIGCPW